MITEETLPRTVSVRERVLEAAEQLVIQRGSHELTLEAVAASAGVSKGGLLYHFPGKEALLTAMIAKMVARFESEIDAALAKEPLGTPGRRTRAFLASFFGVPAAELEARNRTCGAMLAAIASNPRLLDPVRSWYERWRRETESDGLAPERALLALASVDALMFWRLFDTWTPPEAEVAAMHRLVRELCTPDLNASEAPNSAQGVRAKPATSSSSHN